MAIVTKIYGLEEGEPLSVIAINFVAVEKQFGLVIIVNFGNSIRNVEKDGELNGKAFLCASE